jgi:hypothetical protein
MARWIDAIVKWWDKRATYQSIQTWDSEGSDGCCNVDIGYILTTRKFDILIGYSYLLIPYQSQYPQRETGMEIEENEGKK